jgi:hypothetical protein
MALATTQEFVRNIQAQVPFQINGIKIWMEIIFPSDLYAHYIFRSTGHKEK